ncbi:hypothetical protein [Candidatus Neomicrothrix sp.]|uniref:hypothetical protein n=1 Tax=Candidatus Neomicrothrix sp. TaxID=2719034 RepID=UPI0025B95DAB|nr:hypothetical protein [Candidatus Microthrix sp.]
MVSLNGVGRPASVPLEDGQMSSWARTVSNTSTPHALHGWEARLLYDETTGTSSAAIC